MKHYRTESIVLRRLDYGDSDRIVSLITPNNGKISVLAKGARKNKSRLSGGIELFSINEVVVIEGRGDIKTLRSSRMINHFGNIAKNYDKTQVGFSILKRINQLTEENTEKSWYDLAKTGLQALDYLSLSSEVIEFWFEMNLMRLSGRQPDLKTDASSKPLSESHNYYFDKSQGQLVSLKSSKIRSEHIKFARLVYSLSPQTLSKIKGAKKLSLDWLGYFDQ